jgi:hypothetical protein
MGPIGGRGGGDDGRPSPKIIMELEFYTPQFHNYFNIQNGLIARGMIPFFMGM